MLFVLLEVFLTKGLYNVFLLHIFVPKNVTIAFCGGGQLPVSI